MNFALALLATLPLYILICYFLLPDDAQKRLFGAAGWRFGISRAMEERTAVAVLVAVLAAQLLEVALDPLFTAAADGIFGAERFTEWFKEFELPYWSTAVAGGSGAAAPSLLSYYLAAVYIIIHPIMLGFVPAFLLFSGSRRFNETALSYAVMYAISLPFYLFFPVKNVFTAYGTSTPLLSVFDGIKDGWYRLTTENNCFPSLHVAMVAIIAGFAYMYWREEGGNRGKAFFAINVVYAVSVAFAVILLKIHWITDIVGGLLVAAIAIYFGMRYSKWNEKRGERRSGRHAERQPE